MKESYYFPHDFNPTNDPKIICLIGNHGGFGYGVYWRIVEMLHQESNHKLPLKQYIYEAIAKQMQASVEQIQAIVKQSIEVYELFQSDDTFFWSNRVLTNMSRRKEIAEKRSIAGRAGAIAKQNLANTPKGKERKGKKIKINNILQAEPAGIQEVFKIFYDINPTINFGNKTQRAAADRLIKKIGLEKTIGSAKAAIAIHGKKYAPVITNPIQLENKLAELVGFYKSQENNQTIIIS